MKQMKFLGCFNVYNQQELLEFFKGYSDAYDVLGAHSSSIENSISNHNQNTWSYKNYKWKWFYIEINDVIPCLKENVESRKHKDLYITRTENSNIEDIYRNVKEASDSTGFCHQSIRRVIKSGTEYKGSFWKYQDIDKQKLINLVNEKVKNNEIYL